MQAVRLDARGLRVCGVCSNWGVGESLHTELWKA
jgi:hypothetical protein